ncbi:MAG: glycosyltransferase, partial [Desulfurella sp.]
SILQAFLFKIPVVATNAGGVSELIGDNQRGLLVPIKDSQKLAFAIKKLLSEKDFSQTLVNRAFDFVKDFNYKITSKNYLNIYKMLVNRV